MNKAGMKAEKLCRPTSSMILLAEVPDKVAYQLWSNKLLNLNPRTIPGKNKKAVQNKTVKPAVLNSFLYRRYTNKVRGMILKLIIKASSAEPCQSFLSCTKRIDSNEPHTKMKVICPRSKLSKM